MCVFMCRGTCGPQSWPYQTKWHISLLIKTDSCQSILSSLYTFGPEGVNMALALSEGQIGQLQTLREQYDYVCECVCVCQCPHEKRVAKYRQE